MAPHTKEAMQRSMRGLHRHYFRNCKKRNIFFDLPIDVFERLTSSPCAYCGIKPHRKLHAYTYNGIDRKRDDKGYVEANCLPCCTECNFIKGNRLSVEEMKVVAEALKKFRTAKPR